MPPDSKTASRQKPVGRRAALVAAALVIVLALVEIQSFAFAHLSIRNGNSFKFYPRDIFYRLPADALHRENTSPPFSWPQHKKPRPRPLEQATTCGAAFGDSMTHGDDVTDEEAWVFLLSKRLGCDVRNFGIGGYGLSQAALRYEYIEPQGKLVVVGVFIEMIRRDLGASWTFYQGPVENNLPRYAISKPLLLIADGKLAMKPRPAPPVDSKALTDHHENDFYRRSFWTPLGFPYTYSVARAVYTTIASPLRNLDQSSNEYWDRAHSSGSAEMAIQMIGRFKGLVQARGQSLSVVFIPQVEELDADVTAYTPAMREVAQRHPGLCVMTSIVV